MTAMQEAGQIHSNKKHPLRVLHVTDSHLFQDPQQEKFGVRSSDSLHRVMASATQQHEPDVLVTTGDIAQDVEASVYQNFVEIIRKYTDAPVIGTPGNHDLTALFREQIPNSTLVFDSWQIVSVDTHEDHKLGGFVSGDELRTLENNLKTASVATLVVGHHPAAPIDCDWIDDHRIVNGEDLLSLLKSYSAVKCFLTGHVHQASDQTDGNLRLLTTPSTCWQFKEKSQEFAVDALKAGWRWLTLLADGSIDTEVHRITGSELVDT